MLLTERRWKLAQPAGRESGPGNPLSSGAHAMTREFSFCSMFYLLLLAGAARAQDSPAHDSFTTSDGVKIHYLVQGKGTPVILIHGYTGSAEGNWFRNGIAQALAQNHMVVALDCRNHGKSDKPQPNGFGRAEDVIELMDHLKIQKAHFHGDRKSTR